MIFLIIFIVLLIISLLFFLIVILIGRFFYKSSCLRRKGDEHFADTEPRKEKNSVERKWLFSQYIEQLDLKSFDGLNLKGYFINNNSNKLAILVHGYHGRYYSLTRQAKFLYEDGYNLLMINNRCHDTSEGKFISMGKFETRDLKDWISVMIKRNPSYEILLFGVSMGAHIVMMSLNNVESNVKCAVCDCGYASLFDQMMHSCSLSKLKMYKFITWCGSFYSLLFHHFSFHNNTKKSLSVSTTPILLMHGDIDTIVPFNNLEINANNVNNKTYKQIHIFEDCNHCEQIKKMGDEYKEIVTNFIDKFIK